FTCLREGRRAQIPIGRGVLVATGHETLPTPLPRDRLALLPRDLLQLDQFLFAQAGELAANPDGTFLEQYGQEDARGEIRPGQRGMTLVLVVQDGLVVLAEESLPGQADRDDRRTQFPADRGVGSGDGLLRRRRVPSCPGHVEGRLGARGPDRLV